MRIVLGGGIDHHHPKQSGVMMINPITSVT